MLAIEDIPDGGPDNNAPTYEEALFGPDRDQWLASIKQEVVQLHSLNTWEVVAPDDPRLQTIKPLNYKWVHKVKYEHGVPVKFKSRLTVKGCGQRQGIDFNETFSPVARYTTLRIIFALGVTENFEYHQVDFSNAFPNADLEEEVYMKAPKEVCEYLNLPEDSILRLLKALYGLKQASRMWHLLLRDHLIQLGFTQLKSESCVFVRRDLSNPARVIIVVLYVDDLAIAATLRIDIDGFVAALRARFKITDRPLEWILGMHVQDRRAVDNTITLDLNAYTDKMLEELDEFIPAGRSVSTPMDPTVRLSKAMEPANEKEIEFMSEIPYRKVIGMGMYLINALRLDFAVAFNFAARYMANPGPAHWAALQRTLKRLATVPHAYLRYSKPDPAYRNRLVAYSDTDHAGDVDDRKSTAGHVVFLNGAPISWSVRKLKSMCGSSAESEFKGLHLTSMDVMHQIHFMDELGYSQSCLVPRLPTPIHEDNDACIAFVRNPVFQSRMKHIDIAYHVVKEFVEKGYLAAVRVDSANNLADGLTKIQTPALYASFVARVIVLEDPALAAYLASFVEDAVDSEDASDEL